jgi:YD repeat-containing protein
MTPTGTGCTPGLSPYSNNHWSGAPTDLAGNVTSDGLSALTYDSENRLLQSTSSRGTVSYAYDGDGKRVQKTGPNGITVYVYDADGTVAAEYATQGQGSTCTPCYVTQDSLGSVRMVTDASGIAVRRHDFFPFGEEIPKGTNARPSSRPAHVWLCSCKISGGWLCSCKTHNRQQASFGVAPHSCFTQTNPTPQTNTRRSFEFCVTLARRPPFQ